MEILQFHEDVPILMYTCGDLKGGSPSLCSALPKTEADTELKEWVKSESNPMKVSPDFRDPSPGQKFTDTWYSKNPNPKFRI